MNRQAVLIAWIMLTVNKRKNVLNALVRYIISRLVYEIRRYSFYLIRNLLSACTLKGYFIFLALLPFYHGKHSAFARQSKTYCILTDLNAFTNVGFRCYMRACTLWQAKLNCASLTSDFSVYHA